VKPEVEPMQQPIRKIVVRPRTPGQQLVTLEGMIAFVKSYASDALARSEGDYFPVRKAVGKPRDERR
jgi:hypothetical protein